MSKHTQGNWSLTSHMKIVAIIEGKIVTIANVESLPCIGGHDDIAADKACEQERANARLIAAAPELLAALQSLLGADVYADGEGLVSVANADEEIVAQARAAIAKATS